MAMETTLSDTSQIFDVCALRKLDQKLSVMDGIDRFMNFWHMGKKYDFYLK